MVRQDAPYEMVTALPAQSPVKQIPRIAVIGGGMSGLSACYELQKQSRLSSTPVEITLFEASQRPGGVFGTIEQEGYRLETGADMFITNKPAALNLALELGLQDRLIETDARYRRSLILRNGRPVPTPVGFDLMLPRRIWPFLSSPLLSWSGKMRVLSEYFLPGRPQDDETLAAFSQRRFGKEAFERIIQPMIGGIYTADPDKLSLRATLPRFLEMEARYGSLLKGVLQERKTQQKKSGRASEQASGARYALFLSFDKGMSVLQQALLDAVQTHCTVRTENPVRRLEKLPSGPYKLTLADQSEELFDAVLLAIPAPRAATLLEQIDPQLSEELAAIEYASAAIVITGHRLENIRHPMDAFGLVIPAVEKRKILAVSFPSRKFPGRAPEGCVQIRTFIGGALQQSLLENSDQELLEIVQQELSEIFGVTGDPQISRVVRWNQAMPQYHLGHLQRVQQIRTRVALHSRLEVTGNAFTGVGIPDVIQSAQLAVGRLWPQIISR